ncbi:FBX21 protein, partial [Dromaius novaehollandiae]|nr:FBX21 protein [Dromaius novaehollandiae]
MPHISAAALLQICVLLSALPAQYFISQWYGTDSAQRIQITERLQASPTLLYLFRKEFSFLSQMTLWPGKLECGWEMRPFLLKNNIHIIPQTFLNWYYGEKKIKSGENEETTNSYFAESTYIRSPKPEYIQFSVGQVIVHKRFGYSGVIVGWDVKAKAPEEWLQHKYPPAKQDLKDTPHYRILINKANGFGKSTAYIPEEEITIIMGLEVVHHPDMKAYFSGYDGSKYVMQPWLKKIYPHD